MSDIADRYWSFLKKGGIADLSDRAKLRLTGTDRVRYLNGQITANVQKLALGEARPACVTTAKGRLCADIFVSVDSADMIAAGIGGLLVDADATLRASLLERLDRYIVADDVAIADVTEGLGLLHFLPAPGGGIESLRGANFSPFEPVTARRFGRFGFDFSIPAEAVAGILDQFAEHHEFLDEPLLEALRVEAGIPRWGRELDENTLPPEAGLERTHIDYDKGCYIGQEVISRLKSIGHVNRRLVGFVARDTEALQPGMRLFAPGDDAAEIGTLTSAAWSFALERPIALGYLKRSAQLGELLAREAGETGPGRIVRAQDLPLIS